ncbi:MAG TPA: hypothetical protein VI612_01945 [Candidatus Nanoarchaeia archaeon]|nr:hypothetical protein [Candidatus Nanoarchaeia archaeon]
MKRPSLEERLRSFDGSPLELYRSEYAGVTRWELKKRDLSLYRRLCKDRLISEVPRSYAEFGEDALQCYRENYDGLSRYELQQTNEGLYNRMLREGLLHNVPVKNKSEVEREKSPYGANALTYYRKHYAGLTRGQLKSKRPGLYARLRKDGLLKHVPKAA